MYQDQTCPNGQYSHVRTFCFPFFRLLLFFFSFLFPFLFLLFFLFYFLFLYYFSLLFSIFSSTFAYNTQEKNTALPMDIDSFRIRYFWNSGKYLYFRLFPIMVNSACVVCKISVLFFLWIITGSFMSSFCSIFSSPVSSVISAESIDTSIKKLFDNSLNPRKRAVYLYI